MTYLRAFIAGTVFPTILLPIMLCLAVSYGKPEFQTISIIDWIPIIWGIRNILYLAFFVKVVKLDCSAKSFIWGAILSLILASDAVLSVHLPHLLGIKAGYEYLPLLIAPIGYGLVWMLIVKRLNKVVGVNCP